MLWTACCLGFFGFLRVGEFMAPQSDQAFDPGVHLSLQDIVLFSCTPPTLVRVKIKCNKMPIQAGSWYTSWSLPKLMSCYSRKGNFEETVSSE